MRFPFLLLGYFLLFTATLFAKSKDSEPLGAQSLEELIAQEYERILESYQDLTFEQLQERLELIASGDNPLSFDPGEAKYYDVIRQGLKMTEEEQTRFKDNGLVVVDPLQRHSFGSAYYQIYASDLPVLVTTDSVLHAWHRSYDNLLQRIEYSFLMPAIADLLKDCHEQLATQVQDGKEITASYQDVDLYLTVARNLLAGAVSEEWGVKLVVPTKFEQDGEALSRLEDIESLRLQVQTEPYFTEIYGGNRYVDYSQFQPRGHYSESAPLGSQLSHYFRCMMWLGRADCGFNVLPVDPVAGIEVDWRRELLDAALLSELVRDSGNVERLNSICRFIELLTGESDNLTVSQMLALLESEKNTTADTQLEEDGRQLEHFAAALESSGQARQRIRSQSIVSNPNDTHKVLPPSLFQVFGQTFAVDSMLLSHSVFDSIVFEGVKQRRMMPTSLDVAAALGNNHALWLLEPELRKWKYSANLMASRGFVDQLAPSFWKGNVYHRWLDTLRTLDDLPEKGFLPEVMQGSVWRDKQLQTQLASWSELRHDNVLYTKQSYTGVPLCEYPDGFVEPYPALYRKLGEMASTTADRIEALEMQHEIANQRESYQRTKQQQVRFLARFAEVMNQLEAISIQELAGEPMTDAQRLFIETTIDRRGTLPYGSGGKPHYDGWYCELLYDEKDPSLWDPIIADVHTNPRDHKAIQVGVGDVNFAVLAVDNESDVAAYVGPVYSFYEFNQPSEERMTDKQWQLQISTGQVPPRPDWTNSFAASPTKRDYGGFFVRSEGDSWVVSDSLSASQLQGLPNSDDHVALVFRGSPPDSRLVVKASDEGLQELLSKLDEHGSQARFGIALGSVTLKGLKSLVDVKSLAWIDATGSKIAEEDIENFRRLRPDVDVLRRELELETIAVCREIKGLQQFEEDTSGKLKPGQPLLLYLEPKNLTRSSRRFDMVMELKVTLWLVNEPNSLVAHQITEPLELQNFQPGDLKYATLSLVIPESLKRGTYKLVVEIEDVAARPSCIASEEIVLEY